MSNPSIVHMISEHDFSTERKKGDFGVGISSSPLRFYMIGLFSPHQTQWLLLNKLIVCCWERGLSSWVKRNGIKMVPYHTMAHNCWLHSGSVAAEPRPLSQSSQAIPVALVLFYSDRFRCWHMFEAIELTTQVSVETFGSKIAIPAGCD